MYQGCILFPITPLSGLRIFSSHLGRFSSCRKGKRGKEEEKGTKRRERKKGKKKEKEKKTKGKEKE